MEMLLIAYGDNAVCDSRTCILSSRHHGKEVIEKCV